MTGGRDRSERLGQGNIKRAGRHAPGSEDIFPGQDFERTAGPVCQKGFQNDIPCLGIPRFYGRAMPGRNPQRSVGGRFFPVQHLSQRRNRLVRPVAQKDLIGEVRGVGHQIPRGHRNLPRFEFRRESPRSQARGRVLIQTDDSFPAQRRHDGAGDQLTESPSLE
jgi:hypothetical protein